MCEYFIAQAAQRINAQPQHQAIDIEQRYSIRIICHEEDEVLVRTLILQAINGLHVRLQSLSSADTLMPSQFGSLCRITCNPVEQKEIEGLFAE